MSMTAGCAQRKFDLESAVRRIDQISTLPHIALKVMEVANNPDSGAMDLKEVMECDPAMSARVLRCVNSSHYGLRHRITSLSQAVAYLGVKQIRNIAVTTSISDLFSGESRIGPYRRCQLWRHLVSVGVCSRLLAMRCGVDNFEDCFLAGLLHDLGIVLEDQYFHKPFVGMINSLEDGKPLSEQEIEKLGFSHTELAYHVAEAWKFPESVSSAIRYHHDPFEYRGPSKRLVYCVEIANILCTLKGVSSVGKKLVQFDKHSFRELSLERSDIEVIAEDFDKALEEHSILFEIAV